MGWTHRGQRWHGGQAAPLPDPQPHPTRQEGGLPEKALPEGLSLKSAPRLTPALAASSGFPNRSQVRARCPGRKWGAGPHGERHSRPAAPAPGPEHRPQPAAGGVGATHALPRSPRPKAPQGGSLQNQILSLSLFEELGAPWTAATLSPPRHQSPPPALLEEEGREEEGWKEGAEEGRRGRITWAQQASSEPCLVGQGQKHRCPTSALGSGEESAT